MNDTWRTSAKGSGILFSAEAKAPRRARSFDMVLVCFGPTTPTRAGRLADASVDPTDARNDILGCVGRSDRSAQIIVTWPGSRGALLLPSPLRTTRKPFGLCRSSLSQGPLRSPVGRSAPPARYWSGASERDTPETAPAARLLSSALSPEPVGQTVSCGDTRGKSARFRVG